MIYDWGEAEIKDELIQKNNWIQEDLDSIFKFPNSSTIKITFSQTALAKKCTEKGLRAFNISIPLHEIKQETVIPINCCTRGYILAEHAARDCPKDTNYKLCSEWITEGHLWYDCREKTKKRFNCRKEQHISNEMPQKKTMILKEKKEGRKLRGKT